MKNTNFKSTAISWQLLFFCLILFQTVNAQKGDMVLTFSGKHAVTSNIVPLESVKVSNETQGSDTTLYGAAPSLSLQWASGIFEQNHGQKASFVLEPNYPNPFTENTTVNIRLRRPQRLIVTIYDQQGAAAENLEQDFGFGTHRLEITVPQNRLCLLTVNDGVTTKTLKMFSTSGKDYRIKYLGTDENTGYKSETETTAFVFQPGDVLKYTVNAVGYFEYSTFDNPIVNMDYVFSLQPNTNELPPTVTTAAITNITATSATSGGNVTSEGSAAVTVRGVCWSASQNPTIANSFTADGAGTGAFTSAITGLTESITYYVRAYATNQFGTAYGNEVSYTTAALLPVYVCDSAISYSTTGEQQKTRFAYDANGNILLELIQDWNTGYGVWVNNSQTLYTYDATGKKLSMLFHIWDTNIGNWVDFYQSIYTYDSCGNMLSEIFQELDTNIGSLVNKDQNLYTYDTSGNRLSSLYQFWYANIGNWVNRGRSSYTYNVSGKLLSIFSQSWNIDSGSWVNDWQCLYTYDTTLNMLSYFDQLWDTNTGSWVNNNQSLFTYDASGNMLSRVYQQWNNGIVSWMNIWKYNYSYDARGNMLSEIFQDWDTSLSNWLNSWKFTYTYDSNGNILSIIFLYWDINIGNWVNDYQSLYTYDASGKELSLIMKDWDTNFGSWVNSFQGLYNYDDSGNMLSGIYQQWDANIGSWLNGSKTEYQYDYTTRKITAMNYEWSGAWVPVDYNVTVYIFNNYLIGQLYGYKIELWYNSYQGLATKRFLELPDESFYLNQSNQENNDITTGNPTRKDASARINPKTNSHENEAWMDKDKNRLPSQKKPQRNMHVGKSIGDFNHST